MIHNLATCIIDGAGLYAIFATIRELNRNGVRIIDALRGKL